ncbi:PorT family protein [Flavihumibacter rivuli]|uniref:porin family protein n=1 Tax=Flavihumibacter rivuli TaxID=2838156 RepID=UPI001BDE0F59|nr:porin family protein [Flavihumibacter rivuli]ULQ55246.1 PorT family protein [Flavihumibacter rivuli]
MQTIIKSLKVLAVLMLLTSLSSRSYSQTSRFSFVINSPTTYFNYGKANTGLRSYKKSYHGLQAGISYQAGITPIFSLVPELYFAMKGGTIKGNSPLTKAKTTLRINSLEMPLLARLHLNKLYINAGPYVGYNVGGRLKVDASNTSSASTTKLSFGSSDADFKRWDVGFQVGAGYNFSLNQSTVTLDARYGYGMVNISPDVERYNRMFKISAQVSLFGKKIPKQKQG